MTIFINTIFVCILARLFFTSPITDLSILYFITYILFNIVIVVQDLLVLGKVELYHLLKVGLNE